ncbi:hypothetical protein [Pseudonocardia sp. HH130629-09]|uniref:hypothetical protein n=1 Tax=Pseudonocardia sp. HH130629-09 TaxID=1641402 RepID=UPI0011AE23BE|nr:hypothetical protein [Pseudonocardia sp. HH130629-09]
MYEPLLQGSTVARFIYEEFANSADIPMDWLIGGEVPHLHPVFLRWLRQLAGMLAVARVLEEDHGAAPLYGGISLGELAALRASGAITTELVVKFLYERHLQDVDREEAIGFVFVPASEDWRYYEQPDRMTVSCDYGPVLGGAGRMIMVSGLRVALESARTHGPADLQIVDRALAHQAYHSPFRESSRLRLESLLERSTLGHPVMPVVTSIPGRYTVSSGAEAADALVVSETQCLDVPGLVETARRYAPSRTYVISSFLRQLEIDFHVPTEYVDDVWLERRFGSTP